MLIVEDGKNPKVLKSIEHIGFPNLKLMCLYRNNLESIEGLNQINMPLMESLGVGQNNIISIKDLRKGHWRNLNNLFLGM